MLESARVEVPDSLEAANDWFEQERLGDGLPIVPPTEEHVLRMLAGTKRAPGEVVAHLPPRWAPASVEKIAINAVMAGCRPEYLPVVIAAVEALNAPEFNLYGIQATTGYVGPAVIVSGEIARELKINAGTGCFGPGWRANATIGRAIRLILLSIGGGTPGDMDRATFGWPGKYGFCFAEDDTTNPWEPLRVERGFGVGQNTATVVGVNAFLPVVSQAALTGEATLDGMVKGLIGSGGGGHMRIGGFGSGTPVICFSPDTASVVARDIHSKRDIQRYLWERAVQPLPPGATDGGSLEELMARCGNVTSDGIVHLSDTPEDIVIVVCGGPGGHCVLLPGWGGRNTRLVTQAIGD